VERVVTRTALKGLLALSAIEHPCVEAPAATWFGARRLREIPVDPESGVVDVDRVSAWIRDGEVAAVSLMAANNETGARQPWAELAALCREHGAWFHTDAAQWIGKLPAAGLDECDFVTGSGHKFGGGKGVGFLVLPEESGAGAPGAAAPGAAAPGDFQALVGGPQEEGRRAGTENLPAVVAMVTALLEKEDEALAAAEEERAAARDEFERRVCDRLGFRVLGASGPRLGNTSLFVLPHEKNLKWLTRLSRRGFSVSTGSACSAGKGNPSRVMAAMGLDVEAMGRVVRVSGGWDTGPSEWNALADAFAEVEAELTVQ